MATVPTYQQQRVSTQPMPGVYMPADAAMGAPTELHQAMSGSIRAATQLAMEEKQKADQIVVMQADLELGELEVELLTQARQARGRDAFALPDSIMEQYNKRVQEIEHRLSSDTQKHSFNRMAGLRRNSINSSVQSHVSRELEAFDNATTEAYLANARDTALVHFDDPELVQIAIDRQHAAILDHAKRNGLPAEWIKLKAGETISRTHLSVVDRLLANGMIDQAKAHYARNKDGFMGQDARKVEGMLADSDLMANAQAKTDELIASGKTEKDALAEARTISDPKQRDEVVKRLKNRFNEIRQHDQQARTDLYHKAYGEVERAGSVDNIDPLVWQELDPAHRNALHQLAQNVRDRRKPVMDEDAWLRYDAMRQQAINPASQMDFIWRDLMLERPYLPEREFRELYSLQQNMRSALLDGKNAPKAEQMDKLLSGVRTSRQIADDTLAGAGIDPKADPLKTKGQRVLQFRRVLDNEIAEFQLRNGRQASPLEVQDIADKLLVQGGYLTWRQSAWNFTPIGRLFPASRPLSFELTPDDVPPAERARIIEALKRRGEQATEQRIMSVYRNQLYTNQEKGK